jgi:hypothetical protein
MTPAQIRRRADRERLVGADAAEAQQQREVRRWQVDATLGCLQAFLPTADLDAVMNAIDAAAAGLASLPGDDPAPTAAARRADALVALCTSGAGGTDRDREPPSLIVHTTVEPVAPATGTDAREASLADDPAAPGAGRTGREVARLASAEVELGGPIPLQVAGRLACDAKVQTLWQDQRGRLLEASPMRREPPARMLRQLRWRDQGCRFPRCGRRAFTQAHHITFFSRGGPTTLDNLVLVCFLHHRLVHEYGWQLRAEPEGELIWIRPDGVRYRAGPAP